MAETSDPTWNRYRTYLRFLAESRVDPRLKPHVDLSGIVQQTLLEAHQAENSAQATVTLPWLRRILANNLTDEVRRLQADKRDVRRERSISDAIEHSSMKLEMMLGDSAPLPIEMLAREEQLLKLSAAIERLPEAQRQALVLQAWQSWSLAEIAEHMGRTPQAIAGLLKRGLRQLRESIGASDGSTASPPE